MKTCKITKKLTQQIISACNNWMENSHVVAEVIIWGTKRISINIGIWNLDSNNCIDTVIKSVCEDFHCEEEFINKRNEIINKVNTILKENNLEYSEIKDANL